ncbi:MAG: YfcE family phosphodiesterase [Eubacterium sp.]|nr:YfcE family phosphodiesterase [Eubacterium sp.]
MRIVIMSDSHGAVGTLLDIIERHRDNTDLFIFLGDVDNDFDEVLMAYPDIKYKRVAGNNDRYSSHMTSDLINLNGKKIFFTHGHIFHVKHGNEEIIEYCRKIGADICLYGHTHKQFTNYDSGLYIMNPGTAFTGAYGVIDLVDNGIALIANKI